MAGVLTQLIGDRQLNRILEFARLHLGMELAFVAEVSAGRLVFRHLSGDAASFGLAVDTVMNADAAFCTRMLERAIPNAIPDAAADHRVRDLTLTTSGRVGAYLGVPITLSDGTPFGSFGCFDHGRRDFTEGDVLFMQTLADVVAPVLENVRESEQGRRRIAQLIADGVLDIAAQPVFDVHDGRCLGVEALARFPAAYGHTDSVFQSAQAAGLGTPLERLALTHAVGLLPHLPDHHFLAVNASPQAAFDLADVAAEHPELNERLVLEITEHAAVDGYARLRRALRRSREQGLRLAIDDAGAGYASLKHVVELEPDIIKIDRYLIDGVAGDRARRSAVSAFVLLALDIGASVIAEGVERQADLDAVRDLGVDAAQGYLLARPTTDRRALVEWRQGWSPPQPLLPDQRLAGRPA